MPIHFNMLLKEAGIRPSDVRLLRHKDQRADKGRSPYELWRDDRPAFDSYQSRQSSEPVRRKKLRASYWAAFVTNMNGQDLFAGLYRVGDVKLLEQDAPKPERLGDLDKAGSCDVYDLVLADELREFIGKLLIEWGEGKLAWIQRANKQDKVVVELRREFKEDKYPGHTEFILPLSMIGKMPITWQTALSSVKGIYLLTCPTTKEQYIGSATGAKGFYGRWMDYFKTGHGGNVGLKSKDPSDYQVSILEVAGSEDDQNMILKKEFLWMEKLQSKQMGLNN